MEENEDIFVILIFIRNKRNNSFHQEDKCEFTRCIYVQNNDLYAPLFDPHKTLTRRPPNMHLWREAVIMVRGFSTRLGKRGFKLDANEDGTLLPP